ncbi:MAG TPA: c-type cytochrome [Blastocatellia bacterium]|nr:c-type cytochrome [Blastocatellia bacterium]
MNKMKLTIVATTLAAALIALSVGGFATTTPAMFQDGAAIYAEKCAKCHGADGKGVDKFKKQGIKDITTDAWQKANTDVKITAAINNGKGEFMPAWKGKIKPAEIKAVVKHIRSLKK